MINIPTAPTGAGLETVETLIQLGEGPPPPTKTTDLHTPPDFTGPTPMPENDAIDQVAGRFDVSRPNNLPVIDAMYCIISAVNVETDGLSNPGVVNVEKDLYESAIEDSVNTVGST